MLETTDIHSLIIGGGQAGLSASYYLKQHHIPHIVLEQSNTVGALWHTRWDSFCLVTPNWQCQLPGHHYQGDDPDGFMQKHQIIDYIESYAQRYALPVKTSTRVTKAQLTDKKFIIETSDGAFRSDNLIIATGNYHKPFIPSFASSLSDSIHQLHSFYYRNPSQCKKGNILLVGTGQSGCQIAEELHRAGHQMYISVSSAPRVNRAYKGKDVVKWLDDMGYYKLPIDENPYGKSAALRTNHCVSGKAGVLDINMRTLAEQGAKLFGKIQSCKGQDCTFDSDLRQNLDKADEEANSIINKIDKFIDAHQIQTEPDTNTYSSYQPSTSHTLNLAAENISNIIWCTGYLPDYSWLDIPVLGKDQRPVHNYGVTQVPGLYFLGLNWQRYWGSSRLYQVGLDAQFICEHIQKRALKL